MVDAVTTTNAAAGRINAGSAMLASNFETFLSLLTAQLKNQDPLSPVDSNQFTAQLTQMAGVEQQLLTNELLKSMLAAQGGGGLTDAAAFIGRDATAAWSTVRLEDGQTGAPIEDPLAYALRGGPQPLEEPARLLVEDDEPRTVEVRGAPVSDEQGGPAGADAAPKTDVASGSPTVGTSPDKPADPGVAPVDGAPATGKDGKA